MVLSLVLSSRNRDEPENAADCSLRFVPTQEGGRKGSTHVSVTHSTSDCLHGLCPHFFLLT